MDRFLPVILCAAFAAPLAAQNLPLTGEDLPQVPARKKAVPAAKGPGSDPALRAIEKTIRDYVRDQAEEEGNFTVEDDVLARSWDAKLLLVRADTLRRPAQNKAVICVEFNGEDEKDSQPLDLDFSLSDDGESWTVDEIVIHSVGGKARFAYNKKGERVPVKEHKGARKAKAAPAPIPGDAPGE